MRLTRQNGQSLHLDPASITATPIAGGSRVDVTDGGRVRVYYVNEPTARIAAMVTQEHSQ